LAHATLIDPWVPFTVHRSPQRLLYNRASTGFLRGSCRSTTWVDMELARINMRAAKSLPPASNSHRAYSPLVNHTLSAARCSTPPTVPLWSNYTLNPPSLVILPPVLFGAPPAAKFDGGCCCLKLDHQSMTCMAARERQRAHPHYVCMPNTFLVWTNP